MRDELSLLRYKAYVVLSGEPPKCEVTGETNIDRLVIDHRYRDGAAERRLNRLTGAKLYRHIIKLGREGHERYRLVTAGVNQEYERRHARGESVYQQSPEAKIEKRQQAEKQRRERRRPRVDIFAENLFTPQRRRRAIRSLRFKAIANLDRWWSTQTPATKRIVRMLWLDLVWGDAHERGNLRRAWRFAEELFANDIDLMFDKAAHARRALSTLRVNRTPGGRPPVKIRRKPIVLTPEE